MGLPESAKEIPADKYEVTNYQWNKVVEWVKPRL